ncbi:extensin-like domain-containing protein [Pseudooceanicola nitratireducens]|uniref:extensin-like domain-containing protein n=1 Tax=Pseudooceanicola nitratireducens TaxID=517719 RepID=UPI001C97B2E8|nr:extensin family protein [Pseudooceanicola nitratireducens]MBY6158023.1 extensin family protein [Pseudooceanicola nitratireducens]
MKRGLALVLVGLMAGQAWAEVPQSSLRPQLRADGSVSARALPRIPDRPETLGVARQVQPKVAPSLTRVLRPRKRSDEVEEVGRRKQAARRRGAVCGDLDIQGVEVGTVGGPGACGISQAVRVSAVSGVALSTHALMDCKTAKSLKTWVDRGMKPAVRQRGGGVSQIRVVAHYACRTRNNQKGAKLSEHGKGRAVDVAGFTLVDGTKISVLEGWGTRRDGKVLKRMHSAACGPFGTVLGPDANRFHRDHFHFDTARYRSGSYCR